MIELAADDLLEGCCGEVPGLYASGLEEGENWPDEIRDLGEAGLSADRPEEADMLRRVKTASGCLVLQNPRPVRPIQGLRSIKRVIEGMTRYLTCSR